MAGIDDMLQSLNVPLGDLKNEDPRGRMDVLASRLIEFGVRSHVPGLSLLYDIARPLIDGQIVKHLGKFKLPVRKEGQ
jgi:hypothetical protein